ncbi:MAG: hypothetical protein ABSE55_05660 [Terracidiphilus sp.]
MSSQTAMSFMSVAEFVLWAVLGLLFWAKKLQRRFPAMGGYLALRLASMPMLLFFLYGQSQHWFHNLFFPIYFYLAWTVYTASAVFLFFVCMEVFRSALSAFPGLMRFGVVIFRWAVLASVIVSFAAVNFTQHGVLLIPEIAFRLMRSVSVVELCLLGFLCLSMNALRLSARDMAFGIALGFGVMSASDFVLASFWTSKTLMTDPVQFISEAAILLTLGMWVTYCALPERARKPIMVPANSTILRWNEIATALGHTGTQVALQPASGFFLSDVEKVVEEALTRNLKSSESAA